MAISHASIATSSTPAALNTASSAWTTLRVTALTQGIAVGGAGVAAGTGSTLAAGSSAEFKIPPGDVLMAVALTSTGTAQVTRIS